MATRSVGLTKINLPISHLIYGSILIGHFLLILTNPTRSQIVKPFSQITLCSAVDRGEYFLISEAIAEGVQFWSPSERKIERIR